MSNSAENSKNNLSAVERLKAMDKYLDQMRDILTSMDEISKLREQRGEPASDEFGGYKRSSVLNLVRGLEQQKESILAEIAAEEAKRKEGAVVPAAAEQNAPAAEGRASSLGPRESAVQAFRQGDASLAIESMYTGLSMDIEKMRDDILQEMKYTYKQDMAIYDDLSEKIESLRRTEGVNFEDSLRPIGEGITALDEKINALQPVDYDVLADRVAARVVAGGIDYDALAKHIVAVMAGAGVGAAAAVAADNAQAGVSERKLEKLDRKLDDLKNTLNGAVSVKQMPEFRKLDTLIAQYLRTMSYDLIPDILVSANSAREIANRYIVSGNTLRGETMLSDLRVRLSRVNVWGADALTVIEDAIRQNGLPVIYAEDALSAFKEASAAFEQSPAVPDEQLASRVVAAKKALFLDTDMEALDRDTFTEMLEIRDEIGEGEPDKGKVDNLTELKKELMSFNLSYFIDFTPATPEEKNAAVDTQAILDAISRMSVAPAQPQAAQAAAESAPEKIAPLTQQGGGVRKPRPLRPAVSARDNKVEKTEQPLRTVRRSIDLNKVSEDALAKKLVDELAQRIASSRVK